MTNRLILTLAIFLIVFAPLAICQEFKVPEGYKFSSQQDYTRYEPDVIRCVAFLESAPMDHSERKSANAFLVQWLTGTSHVGVQVLPYVMDLVSENKDLLAVYLGGWSRLVLQSTTSPDAIDCHLAGVHSVLKAYQTCEGIDSDSALDELLALDKEGKLREWVAEKMEAK